MPILKLVIGYIGNHVFRSLLRYLFKGNANCKQWYFFSNYFLNKKILGNFCVSSVNSTDFINILHPQKKKNPPLIGISWVGWMDGWVIGGVWPQIKFLKRTCNYPSSILPSKKGPRSLQWKKDENILGNPHGSNPKLGIC